MKKKITVIKTVIISIAMIIAVILAFKIYYLDDKEKKKQVEDAIIDQKYNTGNIANNKKDSSDNNKKITIKWSKFSKDTIAVIDIPNLLKYPVLQGTDNEFYLHKNLDKKYSYSGSIFLDALNKKDFTDDNSIIYGHNMTSGSMFGSLKKYKSESYYKKHRIFYIYTRKTGINIDGEKYDEKLTYKICNVSVVKPTSNIYTIQFEDQTAKQKYLDSFHGLYGNTLPLDKTICTLSTCTDVGLQRLCIQGKLQKREPL